MIAPISSHHYHAAVLGNDLAAAATAALLAKQGYRVAWLRASHQAHADFLDRFTPIDLSGPTVNRYLRSISLPASLVHSNRGNPRLPLLIAEPKTRIEYSADRDKLLQELQREKPQEAQSLHAAVSEVFAANALLEPLLPHLTLHSDKNWFQAMRAMRTREKISKLGAGLHAAGVEKLSEQHVLRACFEFCAHLSASFKRVGNALQGWHFQTWSKLATASCVWQFDLRTVLHDRFSEFGGSIINVPNIDELRHSSVAPFQFEIPGTNKSLNADVLIEIEDPTYNVAHSGPLANRMLIVAQINGHAVPPLLRNRTVFVKPDPAATRGEMLLQFDACQSAHARLLACVRVEPTDVFDSAQSAQPLLEQALRVLAPFAIADLQMEQCLRLRRNTSTTTATSAIQILGETFQAIGMEQSGHYKLSRETLEGFGPEGRLLAAEALCRAIEKSLPRKSWMKRRAWIE